MAIHVVKKGECLALIARKYGFADPMQIWNDPANRELADKRKNPNVLAAGDQLTIPARPAGTGSGSTGETQNFEAKLARKKISFLIQDHDDRPLPNADYVLEVLGARRTGKTDATGKLEEEIPVEAKKATLTIGKFTWELLIAHLDPVEHVPDDPVSGVLQRLRNLGYTVADAVSLESQELRAQLATFQARCGLTITGKLDDPTRKALLDQHEKGAQKQPGKPPPPPPSKPPPKHDRPRQSAPPPGHQEVSYLDVAKHTLATWYEQAKDWFADDDGAPQKQGIRKGAPVASSLPAVPTANALSAPCACFVCTLKVAVAQRSYLDLQNVAKKLTGPHVVKPPDRWEKLLSWFHDGVFEVNIVGIRRRHSFSNKFDDAMITFFRAGLEDGKDAWKAIAEKWNLPDQDCIVGKSALVPCKRGGMYWVSMYQISTDPGWKAANNASDIRMRSLNGSDGAETDKVLKSGESFILPYWHKAKWHVGPHHKDSKGGHPCLKNFAPLLRERIRHPLPQATAQQAGWLRVYKDGQDPIELLNGVFQVTSTDGPAAPGAIDLDPEDVIGEIRFETTGYNMHRAHKHPAVVGHTTSNRVGGGTWAWSEGCQVFADSKEFDQFLRQCQFSKWWRCRDGTCRPIANEDKFKDLGFKEVPAYPQWKVYQADRYGLCDAKGTCAIDYDYVLVEMPGADLDKLRAEFDALPRTATFVNGNKLFVGGPTPIAQASSPAPGGSPTPSTPAAATTPAATTPAATTPPAPTPATAASTASNPTMPAPAANAVSSGAVAAASASGLPVLPSAPPAVILAPCNCGKLEPKALYRAPVTTTVPTKTVVEVVKAVLAQRFTPKPKTDELLEDAVMVLVGQWGVETGYGKSMKNYNFGNQKKSSNKAFTAFPTWEAYSSETAATHAANCEATSGGEAHSEYLGPSKNNPRSFLVKFRPPHRQTHFRAFSTLEEGVNAHLDLLRGKPAFLKGWELLQAHAAGSGDHAGMKVRHDRLLALGHAYGEVLKAGHYATDPDYDEKMGIYAVDCWRKAKPAEAKAWDAAHPKKRLVRKA